MTRVLFGPVDAAFANSYLAGGRKDGTVVAFGPGGDVDPPAGATWQEVESQLGFRPDRLLLWLPYTSVPAWCWSAPAPVIGLAPDWNLLGHPYREQIPLCDAVLTDRPGVDAFRRAGFDHVHFANLFGLGAEWFVETGADPAGERDFDVVFVGNVNPAVQGERLPWLGRLAELSDRYRVAIAAGVFGAEYRALMRRAKVVFNRSIRGEANQRAFEAAAAGAVLLLEADNREIREYFVEGVEFVPYTGDNLHAVIEGVLADDVRRTAIARTGQARAAGYGYEELLSKAVESLDPNALLQRAAERVRRGRVLSLDGRVWQRASRAGSDRDPALEADLLAGGRWHALGAVTADPAVAERLFRRASAGHRVAALARADALVALGRRDDAVHVLRDVIDDLAAGPPLNDEERTSLPVPPGFGPFRVAWESAGWHESARESRDKLTLLRWRAYSRLAELTGEWSAYEAAVRHRPEEPTTRAALGCALARAGRPAEAVPPLRAAVAANPFDLAAARALYQALHDTGERVEARILARGRRKLHRAATTLVPTEEWFAAGGPAGDELASIVVLCCNQIDVTRGCLESVLVNSRPPFELVLVDNGSTDGTAEYLAEVARRHDRVQVIRNATNRGFAAGVNQGIAAATGEWVVLLNNDTVVSPRWLDRLLGVAAAGWPRVGYVGPVTNEAPPPQRVTPGYADLADFPAFAEEVWRANRNAVLPFPRLTGFCLAAHRSVLEKLGPLDEGFGTGFFEDDDLCVRARRAGYDLHVAQGVYLHHHGSRTFAGLGIDAEKQLETNFAAFRAKWGDAEAAPYRRGDGTPMPKAPARVSLTMIVKNEEANLGDCLAGLRELFHEIVVVDTGSTDRTREIAQAHGAKLGAFPWVDDFSAARNAALDLATGDYAFWLDADDRLDAENRAKLKALFASLDGSNAAYVVKCRCVADKAGGTPTVVDHVRLFPLRPDVRWEHRVHEQILPALRRIKTDVRWSDVVVEHVGYVDPAVRKRKLGRDLALLERELAEKPGHPFTLFNLGSVYQELGEDVKALQCLGQSLSGSHPHDSITRKLFALIVQCHRRLGRTDDARAAVAEGRSFFPQDAELLFFEGLLAQEAKDWPRAEAAFRELIGGQDGAHFASVDGGLRGVKARHNLALVYLDGGRPHDAAAEWKVALTLDPAFLPALAGLGEVAWRIDDPAGLENAARRLDPYDPPQAAGLRARGLMKANQFPAARAVLTAALENAPADLGLRILMSHAWLQDGSDPAAAERALLAVLELAPEHRETRHNLAVLRKYHTPT